MKDNQIRKGSPISPFLMNFVKFLTGFAAVIALALFSFQVVSTLL